MEQYTEQEQVRMEKVEKIREYCNPYPERYEKSHPYGLRCGHFRGHGHRLRLAGHGGQDVERHHPSDHGRDHAGADPGRDTVGAECGPHPEPGHGIGGSYGNRYFLKRPAPVLFSEGTYSQPGGPPGW